MADSERVASTVLARLVPTFQAVERHSVTIAASPFQVWAALSQVTTGELRLFRVLLGWAVRFGFTIFGADDRRELVFGAIGRPWRLVGGRGMAVAGGYDFAAFDQAGYAKMAVNFRLDAVTDGVTSRLSTETRVACTDPTSARRFARYWRLIRPASGAIRRSWLTAIKRRAEQHADGEADPRCR